MLKKFLKKEKEINNNEYTKELLEKDISFIFNIVFKNIIKIKNNDFDIENHIEMIKSFSKNIKICYTSEEIEDVEENNAWNWEKLISIVNIEDIFLIIIQNINKNYWSNIALLEQLYKFYTDIYIIYLKRKKIEIKENNLIFKYFDDFYLSDLIKFNFFDLSNISKIDDPEFLKFQKVIKK